ncbi:MAG: VOC family protein [Planctomycetota bacterium]|jgi:predicted enzyme related to lactoylglutathione lyase
MSDEKQLPAYGPGAFYWWELASRDVAKAMEFYTKVIGWKFEEMDMGPAGKYQLITVGEKHCGGMMSMDSEEWGEMPSHWSYYVCVEDVDATVEKALAAGGEKTHDPFDAPGVGRIGVLKDPAGSHFYVIAPEDMPTEPTEMSPCGAPQEFMWVELMARGFDKAQAFYEATFGWTFAQVPMPTGGGEGVYNLISKDGKAVGGGMEMLPEIPQEVPSHWMGYIHVTDIADTMKKAEAEGGTIVVPVMEIPDVGQFGQFCDPTGAQVAVMQPAPQG